MNLSAKRERRVYPRRTLSGLLPGVLSVSDDGAALSCKALDISRFGLGVILNVDLSEETILNLTLKDKTIRFHIMWKSPDFEKNDSVRYGLESLDKDINLEEIFIKSGCLK